MLGMPFVCGGGDGAETQQSNEVKVNDELLLNKQHTEEEENRKI